MYRITLIKLVYPITEVGTLSSSILHVRLRRREVTICLVHSQSWMEYRFIREEKNEITSIIVATCGLVDKRAEYFWNVSFVCRSMLEEQVMKGEITGGISTFSFLS